MAREARAVANLLGCTGVRTSEKHASPLLHTVRAVLTQICGMDAPEQPQGKGVGPIPVEMWHVNEIYERTMHA